MTKSPAVKHRSLTVSVSTPEHGALWSKTVRDRSVAQAIGTGKNAVRSGGARVAQTTEWFTIVVRDADDALLTVDRYAYTAGGIFLVSPQLDLL